MKKKKNSNNINNELDRTKVVVRRLPPSMNEATLMELIDVTFAGRYNWASFHQGKNSQKHPSYSRVYIDFKRAEDVIDFADFFNGHLFVNEKGTQFKTVVEYAPSQHVPKQWSKKDGREGSLHKDPEYLEFLEFLAKPVENLPSAEIQLERREAERAGAAKEPPVVTPLMDFVRQKRAAKGVSRRSLANGKLNRRAGGSPGGNLSPASSKRGSEKKRNSTTMYVLRDATKSGSGKDKPAQILVAKRDSNPLTAVGSEAPEDLINTSAVSGITDAGKKKILLLKGKEKEIFNISSSVAQQQNVRTTIGSAPKQNQRHDNSGKIIRSILLNKDSRQSQTSGAQSDQAGNLEKDKRPPRIPHVTNGTSEDKGLGTDMHGFFNEKQEKRTRSKDRPDRGVWTLRRSDGSYASDESLSSSASQSQLDPTEVLNVAGSRGDAKVELSNSRSGDVRTIPTGRNNHANLDNGSYKHAGRRGQAHFMKDSDNVSFVNEGKISKRGGSSSHSSHERDWLSLENLEHPFAAGCWRRLFFGKKFVLKKC
ncbi:hypothetical protein ACFE04_023858 [Oxalis oulophora]